GDSATIPPRSMTPVASANSRPRSSASSCWSPNSSSTKPCSKRSLKKSGGGTLTGGAYNVAGTFQFPDAAITTYAATVVPDGPTSRIVNQSNVDALTGFASNAPAAILTLQGGRSLTTRDTFSHTGTLIIATDSTFTVTGAYTQPAGSTFLDGGALT